MRNYVIKDIGGHRGQLCTLTEKLERELERPDEFLANFPCHCMAKTHQSRSCGSCPHKIPCTFVLYFHNFHSSSTLPICYREKATKREFPDNHRGYDMVPLSDCCVSALTMTEVGLVMLVTQQMS